MLEQHKIQIDQLIPCIQAAYDLEITQVDFLPLGADRHSKLFKAITTAGRQYIVKVRRSTIKSHAVTLPAYLHDQGIEQVIVPIKTKTGSLWTDFNDSKLILAPYIFGNGADQADLSPQGWILFGETLRKIHEIELTETLKRSLTKETYTQYYRDWLATFLHHTRQMHLVDPLSQELTGFLLSKQSKILDLIRWAENLGRDLKTRQLPFVFCHGDIHASNLLVAEGGQLYIIDWDDAVLAPKERDLMYIGAGITGRWQSPLQKAYFNQGYGQVQVDANAIAYYRFERIIQDIAIFSDRILQGEEEEMERDLYLQYIKSNFQPNGTLEIAYRSTLES
jgi:spectinomycin phosphotransferase